MIELAKLARCAEIAGLRPDELIVGVTPGEEHGRMLDHYRRQPPAIARARIVADLRAALIRGATARAADLLLVLRLLLARPTLSYHAPVHRRRLSTHARVVWNVAAILQPEVHGRIREAGVVAPLFEGCAPTR